MIRQGHTGSEPSNAGVGDEDVGGTEAISSCGQGAGARNSVGLEVRAELLAGAVQKLAQVVVGAASQVINAWRAL